MSVHKGQGSQFPAVIFPTETGNKRFGIIQQSIVYTALSRGIEMVIIIGDFDDLVHAALMPDLPRNTLLRDLLIAGSGRGAIMKKPTRTRRSILARPKNELRRLNLGEKVKRGLSLKGAYYVPKGTKVTNQTAYVTVRLGVMHNLASRTVRPQSCVRWDGLDMEPGVKSGQFRSLS